jgi:hypothetical protein
LLTGVEKKKNRGLERDEINKTGKGIAYLDLENSRG